MSQALTADIRWTHFMRWYVTGGDAAKMGRDATTVLVVLSAYADLATGQVDGLGVAEIAAKGGIPRKAAMVALTNLQAEGYAERLDDRARGRRAIWRLRHRTAVISPDGEEVGVASWHYAPLQERERHRQLKATLESGGPGTASHPEIAITIHQHVTLVQQTVESGGTGTINIGIGGPTVDPDVVGRAAAMLAAASPADRIRWHREAIARGAPTNTTIRADAAVLAAWAGWIAGDLLTEGRR